MKLTTLGGGCVALLVTVAALGQPAAAQINPFRGRGPSMSEQDRQAMLDATQRLNQREHPVPGGVEAWNSPTSSGTVRLDRVFDRNHTVCHAVTYDIMAAPKASPRTYRINWCRTPNGEWKTQG